MKYTIEGFSQEFAMTLRKEVTVGKKTKMIKIDCTDLVILRWFVDFFPNMKKVEVDGVQYAWLTHKKLQDDLPLIDITKRAFIERMQKLVEFDILTYKLVKEGGTFSLYGFGKNYQHLISSNSQGIRSNVPPSAVDQTPVARSNDTGEARSNDIGEYVQPTNKDSSIKDSSINDSSIKDRVKKEATKKETYGTFNNVLLTSAEFERLSIEFQNLSEAIEYLSMYIEENPKYKNKNHNLALRRWVFDAVREKHIKQQELAQREERAAKIAKDQKLRSLKDFYEGNYEKHDYTDDDLNKASRSIDELDDIEI